MSPRPPRALMPRDQHHPMPDDVRMLAALGLSGHDPLRGRFIGALPRETPRERLRGLVARVIAHRNSCGND